VAVALVACTPEVNVSSSGAEVSGIAVSGSGTTSVRPDLALVNLGIEVTSPTVAEARSKAATTMEALTTAVKGKGVAEADIQTQFFNIYPQYGPPSPADLKPTAPQIIGYTVNNQVQLKVRNLDSVSTVLDSAIAAGGNSIRVNGMQFTVEKPDQFKAKAREDAVRNARERAEVLAKAAGVKVGPARSITESGGGFPQFDARSAQAPGGMGGPTPVSPGQETLEVVVNVVFEIER
jgi:uncharacterized protein